MTFSPGSGTTFPLGTTIVTAAAADAAGNIVTSTFTVTVVDTTTPDITGPADIVVDSTSAAGAVVEFAVSASDLVSGTVPVTVSMPSGGVFPIGATTVRASATDAAGNMVTRSFTVTVLSPAQQLDTLYDLVGDLPGLSANETALLTRKLDAAVDSLARGNDNSPRGQLGAFVNQLEGLVHSGRLSAAAAALPITKVQNVIDQL